MQKHPLIATFNIALLFSLAVLIILSLTRIAVIAFVIDWQRLSGQDLLSIFYMGLRFDIKAIGSLLILLFCLPGLLFALLNRWRWFGVWLRTIFVISLFAVLFLCFLDFGYYLYFGSPIDSLAFGILEDGFYEVMVSIFADYRLILIMLVCALAVYLLTRWFLRKSQQVNIQNKSHTHRLLNFAYVFLLTIVMVAPARGSFDTFPLSRKTVNISDDRITNSLMFNAPYHLYYTIKDRREDSFSKLTTRKLLNQHQLDSYEELFSLAGYSGPSAIYRVSSEKSSDKKPHIIFVLMESWSTHIALMDSESNNVLGAFSKHASEDYFFPYFFSNAYGTNPTIDSLLLNSPITPMSQSQVAGHSFAMSNVWPFKQQGYQTLFLSGGSSGWRNHNQFWPVQGFDRYLGRASVESHFGVASDNPWGVYEEYLFEYLKLQLQSASQGEQPLFSFVLTTNNHPPIRLPADYQPPNFDLKQYGLSADNDAKLDVLRGFHYQSNALGEFLDWLKASELKEDVIVVATGDHIYKGFVNYTPQEMAYLRYSVPAYFYLPNTYPQLSHLNRRIPGSHEDLFPTLYELALSKAEYYSFGQNLMKKTPTNAYGWIDQGAVIFDQGVAEGGYLYPWKDAQRMFLDSDKQPLTETQKQVIEKLKYQRLLKKYMLVSEVEKSKVAENIRD